MEAAYGQAADNFSVFFPRCKSSAAASRTASPPPAQVRQRLELRVLVGHHGRHQIQPRAVPVDSFLRGSGIVAPASCNAQQPLVVKIQIVRLGATP